MNPWWWLLVPAAYLLGSVSFAYLAGRLKGVDLRQHGSKNLGATNAGRVLGKGWFFAVFFADLAKGLVPCLVAMHLTGTPDPWLPLATAAAAILGHVFTCFHGFKGGKAVATSLGVLLGLFWQVGAVAFALWLVVWLIGLAGFRLGAAGAVGPASMVAAVAVPLIYSWVFPHPWSGGNIVFGVFVVLVSAVVVVRHRKNFVALFARPAAP